jgi:hypothetical protein
VHAIEASISYPASLFGREVPQEEQAAWTPLFVETIERLGRLLADKDLEPAVFLAISRALRWHAQHSETQTRAAAQTALSGASDPIDRRLAEVLHDGWGHDLEYTGDVAEYGQRRQARLDEVAIAVTSQWADEEIVDHVSQQLAANPLAHGANSGQPAPFISTLVARRPAIGNIICRRVVADPTSGLLGLVATVLSTLVNIDPATALTRANELLSTDDLAVQQSVAYAFGRGRGNRATLVDGETELLRFLIRHPDAVVRRLIAAAARTLSANRHPMALELVTTIQFADAAEVAEEVAGAFGPDHLSWADLSSKQADAFLAQLRACPRIDGYEIVVLLGEISRIDPEAVLQVLMQRVETYEQDRSLANYEPLPHVWHQRLHFRETPSFVDSLRHVISWMANGVSSWYRQHRGAEIFAVVAQEFDEQVMAIVNEAIETRDQNQVLAVGAILRKAPQSLVWDNVPFVTNALKIANKIGDQCVQAIGSGLRAAVVSGGRMGTPGQPFPEDLAQRDRASQIAARLPRGSIEQRFYRSLQASAENRIQWEQKHDRDYGDGREW